ncbi:MAG: hypothetical protein LBT27_02900 [Prevotellaceae bacterium]|jgi:hypothetical protein|nr:hypothetical protein [Prevotellaceae bacterium]
MKKFMFIFIALTFAACGKGNDDEPTNNPETVALIIENNLNEATPNYGITEFHIRRDNSDVYAGFYNTYSDENGFYQRILPGQSVSVNHGSGNYTSLVPGTYTLNVSLRAGRINPKECSCSITIVAGKTTVVEVMGNYIVRIKP